MSVLVFVGADGTVSRHRLIPFTTAKLGRDPTNDIVVRDPKVSRTHAEIIFEKGFFVLRDLSSANGTWINGRRIRVAPLTEGAEVRVGSTIGHYSEEVEEQPATVVAQIDEAAPLVNHYSTMPQPAAVPGDVRGEESESPEEKLHDRDSVPLQSATFSSTQNREIRVVRSDDGRPFLWIRVPEPLARTLASILSAAMFGTGALVTMTLLLTDQPVHAFATVVLTTFFVSLLMLLAPRRTLFICADELLRHRVVTLREAAGFGFPRVGMAMFRSDERPIAFAWRPAIAFGPPSWTVLDPSFRQIGAAHDATARPLLARLTGSLRPLFEFHFETRLTARFDQQSSPHRLTVLDDPPVDPRIVYGLAAAIDATGR